SASTVSELNKKIYGQINDWRQRPIEGEHRKRPADHVLDRMSIFGGSPDPLEFAHVRPRC
ncbi:MAG TPA: hypothetical protein VFA75_17665, partial [Nevskia sp.]|nr:hypothetical protein [Nevskia sp.]